jgi:hypothetical protein
MEVKFEQTPQLIDRDAYQGLVDEQIAQYSFDKRYKGFYDGRDLSIFDPEEVLKAPSPVNKLSEVLTEKNLGLQNLINGLNTDIQILESARSKDSAIKTFDFEGQKYNRNEAPALLLKLKAELKEAIDSLAKADQQMFLLYYNRSVLTGNEKNALEKYKEMFSMARETNARMKQLHSMVKEANQLFRSQVTHGVAVAVSNNMKREGNQVKEGIREMLSDENYTSFYSTEERNMLQSFLDDSSKYFFNTGFDSEAIQLYMNALTLYAHVIGNYNFLLKKTVLNDQIAVIDDPVSVL